MNTDKMLEALKNAAAKAGFDARNVKVEACTTDNTWGDRCGYVFFGGSDEVNERAAHWFLAWYSKCAPQSSYNAQRSISYFGELT